MVSPSPQSLPQSPPLLQSRRMTLVPPRGRRPASPSLPRPFSQRPLLIFCSGMDGSGLLPRHQVESVESEFELRCLALPRDDCSLWPCLVEDLAERIGQEQRRRGTTQPVYLCGESFGACLAMKLAQAHPTLVAGLVLINPASALGQVPWLHWGSWATEWLPAPLYPLSTLGLLPFLIAPERVLPSEREALLAAMQAVQPRTVAWRLSLLRQFDLTAEDLRRLSQPVLLVAGGCDRLLPSVQEIQRLAQYFPQAQTCLLPQSGHACLLEWEVSLGWLLRQFQGVPV